MPETFVMNCELVEKVVRGEFTAPTDEPAKEAVLDCLIVLLEAADELKMRNTAALLDVVADIAFSEYERTQVPTRSLIAILKIAESANAALPFTNPPIFASSRNSLAVSQKNYKKSA